MLSITPLPYAAGRINSLYKYLGAKYTPDREEEKEQDACQFAGGPKRRAENPDAVQEMRNEDEDLCSN